MEWVETTAKTVEEAKELALDQLGVVADDAEFEVLATPKPGLFGRVRGEARVRARVRPAPVRPKQERRRGRRGGAAATDDATPADATPTSRRRRRRRRRRRGARRRGNGAGRRRRRRRATRPHAASDDRPHRRATTSQEEPMSDRSSDADAEPVEVDVDAVRDAARGVHERPDDGVRLRRHVDAAVDGNEIEVRVDGDVARSADRPRRAHAAGDPGPRPGRRPAAPRRSRDAPARRRRRLPGEAPGRPRAIRRDGRRAGHGDRRRPVARPDAVGGPQGPPRRAGGDRRRDQPVRGRGSRPPGHRHARRDRVGRCAST